jgi:putative hydrolase of the HAD superfamily
MRNALDGIAFDLDGTLYPNYRLYIRLIPFIVKELRLLLAMGKARNILRDPARAADVLCAAAESGSAGAVFYRAQARLMAEILGAEPETVEERTVRLIYRGWEPFFTRIAPYDGVRETLEDLRAAGLKLGLLSDFPPEKKIVAMGLDGFWDVQLCSELTGRLKPDPAPFRALAEEMRIPPERLLYVGNSVSYDVIGAKTAGMRAALIVSPLKKNRLATGNADFVFSRYRQLAAYVLQ